MAGKRNPKGTTGDKSAQKKGPKRIEVGDGWEVVFDQRARGEETRYWKGRAFKDGADVGYFSNDGRGGNTMIQPTSVAEGFRKLVDAVVPAGIDPAKLFEREDWVIHYAEIIGYSRSKTAASITLADVVREFCKDK
jgi:hypothetical protein